MPKSVALVVWVALVALTACRPAGSRTSPEGFTLRLRRGPCLGGCPVYSVTVASDGSIDYDGARNVSLAGAASTTVAGDSAAALLQALDALGFDSLPDRYAPDDASCGPYIADLPVLVLTVRRGDRTKRVEYDPGCADAPAALGDLARRIDQVTQSSRWTGR